MIYTTEAVIGGYIVIIDREHNDRTEKYTYVGTTKTYFYVYRWDTVKPYHCIADKNLSSTCPQYLDIQDLTENVRVVQYD